jgi:hypothetical protein
VHLEAYLHQSSGFDGRLTLWQDGQQLFDFQDVRTCYDNPTFNSWRCDNLWSLNNYSDGLSPNPATIYVDDAAISLTRLGPVNTSTPSPTQAATSTPFPTSTRVPTSTPEPQPSSTPVPQAAGDGLTGQYFDHPRFRDLRLTRIDRTVNFDWGAGSPAPGIGSDKFSVRWTGYVVPRYSETYTFHVRTDGRLRLRVNDREVVESWDTQSATETTGTIALEAGRRYPIQVEYSDMGGDAVAELSWSSPSQTKGVIPQSQLFAR